MLSLWVLHLSGLHQSLERSSRQADGRPVDGRGQTLPSLSTISLLDAYRDALSKPNDHAVLESNLPSRLSVAHVDSYDRKKSKASRLYPRKVKAKKCGLPKVRAARAEETHKLKTLIAKGLYQPLAV